MDLPAQIIVLWTTREEFLATYGYQLVAWWHPAYYGAEMTAADRDEHFQDLDWALNNAVRELMAQGFKYEGLEIDARGQLVQTRERPVTPENLIFLRKLNQGRLVSPIAACTELVTQLIARGLDIDRGPIREVLAQCQKDSDEAKKRVAEDPEFAETAKGWVNEVMGAVGLIRPEDKPN